MRYTKGMQLGPRLALRIAREELAAHVAAMDLEQLFGDEAVDGSEADQELLTGAQNKIVRELRRKANVE